MKIKGTTRKNLGIIVALSLALPATAVAGDHPTTVGPRDVDGDRDWVAASRVLAKDGSVKAVSLPWRLREGLEWQVQNSSTDHGLEEGEIPSPAHCAPVLGSVTWPPGESGGDFASTLLLSEVAIIATLNDAVPGFTANGNPWMLFPLADVVPLHGRSSTPDYVLVPYDRLVVRGRVFCAVNPSGNVWRNAKHPKAGDRVVLVGRWNADGVMRTRAFHPETAALALVGEREELIWKFGIVNAGDSPAPRSLSGLQDRVDEAAAGGLFDLTAHLHAQEWGSPERREFAEKWRTLHQDGCRVVEVANLEGHGLVPVRKICSPLPR